MGSSTSTTRSNKPLSGPSRRDASLPTGGDGRSIAHEQTVGRGCGRTGLRQEQGGEEERMIGNLDDPDLARAPQPAHPKSAGLKQSVVVRVDTVVAVIVLGRLGNAVERRGAGLGEHEDRLRLPDERARERRDDESPGTGCRLGALRSYRG